MKKFGVGNYFDPNDPQNPTRLEALWRYLLIVTDNHPEIVKDLYNTFYPVFYQLDFKWPLVPPELFDENPALLKAFQEWRDRSTQLEGVDDLHLRQLVGHIGIHWKADNGRFRSLRDIDPVFVYTSEEEKETFRFSLVKTFLSVSKRENGGVTRMKSPPSFQVKNAKYELDYDPLAEPNKRDAKKRILATFERELDEHIEAIEVQMKEGNWEKNMKKRSLNSIHFKWLYLRQVRGYSTEMIANAIEDKERKSIQQGIDEVAMLAGVSLKRLKSGRKPKKYKQQAREETRRLLGRSLEPPGF